MITQITTYVSDVANLIISQFKGRQRLTGLINIFVEHAQLIENALFPMIQYRQLSYAYGAQLDVIGAIVGISRNGLDDATYYVFIVGTIAKNFSDTTSAAMLNIVQTLYQAQYVFKKDPNSQPPPPEGAQTRSGWIAFGVVNPQTSESLYPIIEQIIEEALGGGIALTYVSTAESNANGVFSCAGPAPWVGGYGAYSYAPDASVGAPYCALSFNNTTR